MRAAQLGELLVWQAPSECEESRFTRKDMRRGWVGCWDHHSWRRHDDIPLFVVKRNLVWVHLRRRALHGRMVLGSAVLLVLGIPNWSVLLSVRKGGLKSREPRTLHLWTW